MLEETATVVRVEGETAWIATRPRSACSHCASAAGCETGMVSKVFGQRTTLLQIDNPLGAGVGDQVVVGIPDALLVKASGIAYLMPLFGLIATVVLAELLGFGSVLGEGGKALLGLSGLAAGMLLTRRLVGNGCHRRYQPQMLRRSGAEFVFTELRPSRGT
jgi:sigma-E factor negative regulatory protein RseC